MIDRLLKKESVGHCGARKSCSPYAVLTALIVIGLFSLAAPAAKADTWNFALTDPSNTTNVAFSFLDGASSTNPFGTYFQLDSPVDWTLNGVDQGAVAVSFWNVSQGGGLLLGNNGEILNLWGPQLYTGTESAPSFVEGTYSFTSCCNEQFNGPFTLTLVDPAGGADISAQAPEPSSFGLIGTGLLGLIGLAGYQARRGRLAYHEGSATV